ncbi:hypothetical protein D779_1413 [Imhoffiella purpurea]|uniref:Uncharacterized protein n=1 Tax=Imhoffiella purpurea TaxID=1249627 RepID=W9VH20_9GAMM|nr:hypothetical protein D779_1413 [Imhoffiella purpurea]
MECIPCPSRQHCGKYVRPLFAVPFSRDLDGCSLVETKGLRIIRENLRLMTKQLNWLQDEASGDVLERRLKPLA